MKSNNKLINIVRWTTRVLSILTALLFIVFFIGEGIPNPASLSFSEWLLMLFVPVMLIAGMVVAWMREMLGGILVVASILLFNLTAMITEGMFNFELEFGFFLIIGFGFIFCGFAKGRLRE